MKKSKRILAIAGVVLLVALYASTLVFALFDPTTSFSLFKISIICTIIVPVLLYAYTLIYRIAKGDKDDKTNTNSPD